MISANLVKRVVAAAGLFVILPVLGLYAADSGLISKPSDHSVQETVERFEKAVKARGSVGWMVFTEIDHAAAAGQNGLTLKPRTVIVFGNPKLGTKPMEGAPTLAIDVPLRALVWQDDKDKVWLTYNSAGYLMSHVYPDMVSQCRRKAPRALTKCLRASSRKRLTPQPQVRRSHPLSRSRSGAGRYFEVFRA